MTFSSYTKSLVQAGSAYGARAKSSTVPARRLAQTCVVRHTPTHACARSLHERGADSSRARDNSLFECPRSSLRNAKRAYKHQTGPEGVCGHFEGFEATGRLTVKVGLPPRRLRARASATQRPDAPGPARRQASTRASARPAEATWLGALSQTKKRVRSGLAHRARRTDRFLKTWLQMLQTVGG